VLTAVSCTFAVGIAAAAAPAAGKSVAAVVVLPLMVAKAEALRAPKDSQHQSVALLLPLLSLPGEYTTLLSQVRKDCGEV